MANQEWMGGLGMTTLISNNNIIVYIKILKYS